MPETSAQHQFSPKIIHCFRSPVGGLFRHIYDLIQGQSKLGLKVGLICDSLTGDSQSEHVLAELAPYCSLGTYRLPMNRSLHWSDSKILGSISKICEKVSPQIIHGHGAKGGAYARLVARGLGAKSIYTPHGGSLHYKKASPEGVLYFTLERYLMHRTDGLIFESQYSADTYSKKIGAIKVPHQTIHHGLYDDEFDALDHGKAQYDFVFIGELRKLKGLEILLQAINQLRQKLEVSLLIVGAGPDADFFRSRIHQLGLDSAVTMAPPVDEATDAFVQARCLIVPSLAESLPYIVLEAAASKTPLVATLVGGIPEIYGPYSDRLVIPNNPKALSEAMHAFINDPQSAKSFAQLLHDHVKSNFRIDTTLKANLLFYEQVLHEPAVSSIRHQAVD